MSENDIGHIDNESFKILIEIINLSLSRNSIAQIELFAFTNLRKLTVLDLSDNRLEQSSFDSRIFENNEKLTFLDLSRNNFLETFDSPLLKCQHLKTLSIRNSHLSHIHDSFFSGLKNLINLDLSENVLLTLPHKSVMPLKSLKVINLEYNRINCELFETTQKYLENLKIILKIDRCGKHSKKPMFEKMILAPELEFSNFHEDVDIDLVWGENENNFTISKFNKSHRHENASEYYKRLSTSEISSCEQNDFELSLLCECVTQFSNFYEMRSQSNRLLIQQIEHRILVVFYLGLVIGAICGVIIFYTISITVRKCKKLKHQQNLRQRTRDYVSAQETVQLRNRATDDDISNRRQQLQQYQQQQQHRQVQSHHNSSYRSSENQSSTAQLIHKLFRNRETPSGMYSNRNNVVLPPSSSSSSSNVINIPHSDRARTECELPTHQNDTEDAISTHSDEPSIRSGTPPPAYVSIFN